MQRQDSDQESSSPTKRASTTESRLDQSPSVANAPISTAEYQFRSFIGTYHVSFFLAFSALLVISGGLLILISREAPLPVIRIGGPLDGLLASIENPMLLLGMGVLLVLSPLYVNSFVFSALHHERGMRERAQNSTREARLLQDILTHDVRNYNQAMLLFANRIEGESPGNEEVSSIVASMVGAVGRSTDFVERAKKLGKIISEQDPKCGKTDLAGSLARAIEVERGRFPTKKVIGVVKLGSSPIAPLESLDRGKVEPWVVADAMLDEVFGNIFANSIEHTEGDQVFIAMELRKEYDRPLKKRCWKISIDDVGNGIPDQMKRSLFARYTEPQNVDARGLGMSIVHALVVGRYGGRIQVRDRVAGDHGRGALVDIWLPAG
jgi:signal transduction histidine kinase